ncbi:MAG: hypothetical protein UR45_C0001G0085 [candidate division WS6 bacterium GW2011_WS6_33_547]|nr:MAG: hypothetical protein UR45_C0001G0085 [candidate division WS6 bacterium GW2011_WS6_33_547]
MSLTVTRFLLVTFFFDKSIGSKSSKALLNSLRVLIDLYDAVVS